MASNFDFLKNKDKKLFNIIYDAEKLYRDGYFEQTIAQTRKFAEILAKNMLGIKRSNEETFDEILATLKDMAKDSIVEKEFIDDMYFLKKQGNLAVHDDTLKQGGNIALECLKRAFEAALCYSIKNKPNNKKLLNSHYDIDLLMTGKTYKFSEKYQKIKEEADESIKKSVKEIVQRTKDEEKNKKQTNEKKILKADFKNKKIIREKPNNKKYKKEKAPAAKKNSDILFYIAISAVFFIFLFQIFLFIFPF